MSMKGHNPADPATLTASRGNAGSILARRMTPPAGETNRGHKAITRASLITAALLGAMTAPALAAPDYSLLTTIALPVSSANSQGGNFTAFDISYVDPATGDYYVADRSNAAVDIINGASNTVLAQAGVGSFTGQQATTSTSGPDGVVVTHNGASATLWAGNGNSTTLSFNVTNPSSPTALFTPVNTGGIFRNDEMSWSPANNLLLVANNAEVTPFATLINSTNGNIVKGNITIPNTPANGGLEQSVWDPKTGTFFVSVPAFNGANNPGGVAQISTAGNVIASYDLGALSGGSITACSSAGLALGASGNLLIGCSATKSQTVLLNPTANGGAGAIVKTFNGISGSDEVWYDSASGDYFVTGDDGTGSNRIFGVISDATGTLLQTVALPGVNAHSIAVDPFNLDVFVPLEGSVAGGAQDALCPNGCIAVFAQAPEPPSLALLLPAFLGVVTAAMWRRRVTAEVAPPRDG
jgi:hypothetical protein